MSKKIAIIGGGASGMIAAITAASKGAQVDLFEANDDVGKKILASGNGRCNISNQEIASSFYEGLDPKFTEYALNQFSFAKAQNFFKSLGLYWDIKADGKAYPLSNEAKSVVLVLKTAALSVGVSFFSATFIQSIAKEDGTFVLTSEDKHYSGYDKLLIATGSEAAPQLGSNDSGYTLAQTFQHTIIPTYPSLVQLELDSKIHAKLSGIKQHAKVSLLLDGSIEATCSGDILFTRYGISGFAILDLSQKASLALIQGQKVVLALNLLPEFDRQSLANQLSNQCSAHPNYTLDIILSGLISSKIVPHLLEALDISPGLEAKSCDMKMIKKVVNLLCNWRFNVSDTHGFKHAEVSGGGISTFEVNPHTMESTLVKGLYFSGEVLDIVGSRGGYNFHFAWASGRLAALSMVK